MPGNSEMMNCGIRPTKFISLADKLSAYKADLFGELAQHKRLSFYCCYSVILGRTACHSNFV